MKNTATARRAERNNYSANYTCKTNNKPSMIRELRIIAKTSWIAFTGRTVSPGYCRKVNIDRRQRTFNSKFQKVSSMFWSAIALIFFGFSCGAPLSGMGYGITTMMKYMTIENEAHDLMTGILWDLNAGMKDYIISQTEMGRFLDTIHSYNFVQTVIILVCTALFVTALGFLCYAVSKTVKHFKNFNQ